MFTTINKACLRFGLGMAMLSGFISGRAAALTVTATTSDNGYPAHLVSWTDASGNPRSAMMVDQNSTGGGPYTGYMRQYTYLVSGTPRVCTGQYSYSTGGNLEFSGDGFVQNHGAYGADDSTGNGVGFAGTTTISPSTGTLSHVTITYSVPGYTVQDTNGNNQTVPTTVQWFFADGRNDPIFTVTQDASATPGALGLDSRSPYGDIEYDGATTVSGGYLAGNNVGGFSYGDQYKFTTTSSGAVTPESSWTATTANTIPYAMQWTQTTAADAEMGHVATVPLLISDAGSDSQTSAYYNGGNSQNNTLYFDPRGQTSSNNGFPDGFQGGSTGGYLPPWNTMAFQIINASGDSSSDVGLITNPSGLAATAEASDAAPNPPSPNSATTCKKVTWQTNFGRLGGFDFYGQYTDSAFNYSTHSLDINAVGNPVPVQASGQGARASGAVLAYSTFVVLGLHSTGTVAGVVTQMQNVTAATLAASTGSVVTSGPEGVAGAALTTNVTYSPAGYNPVYSTWEITASGNAVSATLTPATGKALINPVFLIDNYTSSQLPSSISINGQSTSGTNYYATLDTVKQRLWITANSTASSAMTLVVNPQVASNQNTSTGTNALANNTSGINDTANGYGALESNTSGFDNSALGTAALLFNQTGSNNTATGSYALEGSSGHSTGSYNTATGSYALADLTSGSSNTASGYGANSNDTTGADNTSSGALALLDNTTGSYNTAVGDEALTSNTGGTFNTAQGIFSLLSNTTGNYNTSLGGQALYSNTTGSFNTATGVNALFGNTTGSSNTANGLGSLFKNTTGSSNTAIGYQSLYTNSTGYSDTANGDDSLLDNTTGYCNTATGDIALEDNTTGFCNTAEGVAALQLNTGGAANTAIGFTALYGSTGNGNIGVGYQAGVNLGSGSNNIDIGNAGASGDSATVRLGTQGTQTQTFVAGIYGTTGTGGLPVYVLSSGQLATETSSAKFKKNIRDMGDASDALLSLRPVTFQYKSDPTSLPQFGLVAEEVAKVAPTLVVHDANNQIEGVRYEAVNAMLLNEFQKQHQTIAEQQATIAAQQQAIADQQKHAAEQDKLLKALAARLDQIDQPQGTTSGASSRTKGW